MQMKIEQMLNSEPKINKEIGKMKSLETWKILGPLSIDFLRANVQDREPLNFDDKSRHFLSLEETQNQSAW